MFSRVEASDVTSTMSRKLQKFLVLLDNESLLYFPGSFLSGKVVVELDEEIPVTGGALGGHAKAGECCFVSCSQCCQLNNSETQIFTN